MKKILVPTDLSSIAELGLKLATEIAKPCRATIYLVNFIKHPLGVTFAATGDLTIKDDTEQEVYTVEILKMVKERLEEIANQYRREGFTIETAVVDNEFKSGIDEYLKAEAIDLVVMGTSGQENAKEVFTGNHTEQAIKVSACPVLSVRDGFESTYFNNLVVGVNVIPDLQLADGLRSITLVSECFNSKIHLVHVRDKASDSTLLLDEYFNRIAQIAQLTNYVIRIIDADDTADGLLNYAQEVKAGLIAIIKNSKEGIFRIFSNHLSDRIVKEQGGPVITVNLNNTND
ncbi:universal stress protein [Chryseosolibacter indicus]|uniref:Universal stress protein n=1 Tax=Chryseosolibacter indicus TaxID=2782351 RepID=A0ABS5VL10_9BACT|nr:universal stress protein [Chryseosolibacter indicus]MBT1701786.1 universal stress protein [Chryseosolibacter indicus]